jgi:AIG2-like family
LWLSETKLQSVTADGRLAFILVFAWRNLMALVFQYGSNADSERLNSTTRLQGEAKPIGIAYTEQDFELDFTVWSKTNACAAADIVPCSGRKIWGVIYEIPDYLIKRETAPSNRKSLDSIEGAGTNYKRIPIDLRYLNGLPVEGETITYVVLKRTSDIQTSLEYASHILKGLREQKVPDEYIEYVKRRIGANNPDLKNEIKHL